MARFVTKKQAAVLAFEIIIFLWHAKQHEYRSTILLLKIFKESPKLRFHNRRY